MRKSGVVLHISSLPSPHGIGTFGQAAYDFVDFLAKAKQGFWQVLPLGITGYGDSPYQSFSTFAGNPYFIDLDELCAQGLLDKLECEQSDCGDERAVDFGGLYTRRYKVLRTAYSRFAITPDYLEFVEGNLGWLDGFCAYMTLKTAFGGAPIVDWKQKYKRPGSPAVARLIRKHGDEYGFWAFTQYEFTRQWNALKSYANSHGVQIIGDVPIYVSGDSADVWENPRLFELDWRLRPREVAGCPPDAYSATGQLWGNPIYNWEYNKAQGYAWWISRLARAAELFDVVRIDHFRGFESFYAIPRGSKTAQIGVWRKGPGIEFFGDIKKALGDIPIIAENLGFLTDAARELHTQTGYPGMKVLEFAFGSDLSNEHLPDNVDENTVFYPATHDCETLAAFCARIDGAEREMCEKYAGFKKGDVLAERLIELALSSKARLAMVTLQDWLGLADEARMNEPATDSGNWRWRSVAADFTQKLAKRIAALTEKYKRN